AELMSMKITFSATRFRSGINRNGGIHDCHPICHHSHSLDTPKEVGEADFNQKPGGLELTRGPGSHLNNNPRLKRKYGEEQSEEERKEKSYC
ncbi:hypothetical protein NW761_002307, partial [Fusarium oxysporum]